MRPVALVFLLCWVPAKAQLLDSLALFTKERPHCILKLDSRGSFISNSNVTIMGVKAGLEHAGRFQYGVGYSFLWTPVEAPRTVNGVAAVPTTLRLGYLAPYVEYAFYQRGPWEVRIPVQFGIGSGSLAYFDTENRKQRTARSLLLIYEPSMTVQYRFLKYFGANVGWGYRLLLVRTDLDERLTAPIYVLGLKVFFGDLWKDLRQ